MEQSIAVCESRGGNIVKYIDIGDLPEIVKHWIENGDLYGIYYREGVLIAENNIGEEIVIG